MSKKNFLFLIPSLFLAYLVFQKAFIAPFTHDEAFSFLTYSSKGIKAILTFKEDVSANNHILNTLFMKFMSGLGLVDAGFLRLLSSLSFLLIVYSLFKLNKTEENPYSALLILIVVANPYLLDFFAMARGYGLSFGFMIFSIYLLLKEEKNHSGFLSMQIATLAMMSNFNLVYFWVPFGILHLFKLLKGREINLNLMKQAIINYAFPLLSLFYLMVVFKRLSDAQQLYFGGKEGIINNLVNDQLWCLIYDKNYAYNELFLFIWQWVPVCLILIGVVLMFFKKVIRNSYYQNWLKVLFILVMAFVLIELNHRLTGSLYPIKRTGLFMSVLLGVCLMLFFRFLLSIQSIKIPIILATTAFSGLLFVHSINCYNTMRFREIPYDCHQREIIQTLEKLAEKESGRLDLSANWQLGPVLNFYKKTKKLDWLPETNRDPIRPEADYLLVFEEDLKILNQNKLEQILAFPEDGLYLMKTIQ